MCTKSQQMYSYIYLYGSQNLYKWPSIIHEWSTTEQA